MPKHSRIKPSLPTYKTRLSSRRTIFLSAGVLTLAATVCYSNTFAVPFLFDDQIRIENNALIRQVWPVWVPMENSNRPFGMFTFAINYALHGYRLWGFHATNLAIHVLAGLSLFGIVRRTIPLSNLPAKSQFSVTTLAFAIALIWLVHPLNTQAVTYIVQRLESLMGLCYLLTLYCFIRSQNSLRPIRWYTLSIVCCAFGMGVKEVMATAPVMVLWYDRVFVSRSWRKLFDRNGRYYVGLFSTWGVLVWCMLRSRIEYTSGSIAFVEGLTPLSYLISQAGVITHYLRLSVWPYGQCLDYAWPVAKTPSEIVPAMLFVGFLFAITIWAIFRRPRWGFLGGWFFVVLAPTSSVVPIIDLAFEQRMYLPLVAVVVAMLLAIDRTIYLLVSRWRFSVNQTRFTGGCAIGLFASQMAALTWMRNEVYQSEIGMWENTVATAPSNARAHQNLGTYLLNHGKLGEAFEHCKKAIELRPDFAEAYSDTGAILARWGKLPEAMEHHQKALALKPNSEKVHNNYGIALDQQGLRDEALAHFREAATLKPGSLDGHCNLGKALAKRGNTNEALAHLFYALQIRPEDPKILYDTAVVLDEAGRIDEAIRFYREAVRHEPAYAEAHHNLGVALTTQGNPELAISHFRRALEINPRGAFSHLGLGDALAASGQPLDAIRHWERAHLLDPNLEAAQARISGLREKLKQSQ